MKKIYFLPLLLLIFFSCASDQQLKALQNIADFYGGEVYLVKGVVASTESEQNGKYYEVKLNNSEGFNSFENPELPASNVALLFFNDLTEEEIVGYSSIRVMIDKDEDNKYEYTIEELKEVKAQVPYFNQIMKLLKLKNYPSLFAEFHTEIIKHDLNESKFKRETEELDSLYGKIKTLQVQGFTFSSEQLGETYSEVIRISGTLQREKENMQFSITVDPLLKKRRITGLRYEL